MKTPANDQGNLSSPVRGRIEIKIPGLPGVWAECSVRLYKGQPEQEARFYLERFTDETMKKVRVMLLKYITT